MLTVFASHEMICLCTILHTLLYGSEVQHFARADCDVTQMAKR